MRAVLVLGGLGVILACATLSLHAARPRPPRARELHRVLRERPAVGLVRRGG
jgi:hypothetical protein